MDLGGVEDKISRPPRPDWMVQIGDNNVSRAIQKVRFSDVISQPGDFTIELLSKADIEEEDLVLIRKNDADAFTGVVKNPEDSAQRTDEIKGSGDIGLLYDKNVDKEFLESNTDDIMEEIFSDLDTTSIELGDNERLNEENDIVFARADDEDFVKFMNRVVMSYGGEWYTEYDSDTEVVKVHVVEKIESDDIVKEFNGGSETGNIENISEKKVFDQEYDAVVVKGYGDGEDQVKAAFPERSEWPSDADVLKYTNKTILSENVAEETAKNMYEEHTEWRNVFLEPANKNQLLSLGDKVDVNDQNTGIEEELRVVKRKLNIKFDQGNIIEYVLSDRPIGMLEDLEDTREQTKSETDYGQGNRNTINENESELVDGDNGLTLSFNIPERFTQDKTGKNRVSDVRLDFEARDYRKFFEASDVQALDDTTKIIDTTVDDFGDVENDLTDSRFENTADFVTTDVTKGGGATSAAQDDVEGSIDSYSTGENSLEIIEPDADDTQGMYVLVSMRYAPADPPSDDTDTLTSTMGLKIRNTSSQDSYPSETFIGAGITTNFSAHTNDTWIGQNAQIPLWVPENTSGEEYNILLYVGHNMDVAHEVSWNTFEPHIHEIPETPDGAENANVRMVKESGDNFDASENASQTNESVPNDDTVVVSELDSDEPVLAGVETNAETITVLVNDEEISDSPFSELDVSDIDISDYVEAPGKNRVDIIPDDKAYVKSNVIVDHKIEGDR